MKTKITSTMLGITFLSLALSPQKNFAQKAKGESVVTVGIGYSLVGVFFSAVSNTINTEGTGSSTTIPVLVGMYDYGLAEHFSIGVAYSYQSISVKYTTYTNKDNMTLHGNFTDVISRQNIGIRPLFHFGQNKDLDMYAGARVSYSIWTYKSDVQADYTSNSVFQNGTQIQLLFGLRYLFSDHFGFNIEGAIGPSYFAMLGGNYKF